MSQIPELTENQIARFWSKTDKSQDCWLWTGWKTSQGYGRFDVGSRKVLATRLALELSGRPEPEGGALALHGDGCVSTSCCNPAHLRWGDARENAADRERLDRGNKATGARNWNSKLNPDLVRYIRSSPKATRALARELGVTQPAVKAVRHGQSWKHVV